MGQPNEQQAVEPMIFDQDDFTFDMQSEQPFQSGWDPREAEAAARLRQQQAGDMAMRDDEEQARMSSEEDQLAIEDQRSRQVLSTRLRSASQGPPRFVPAGQGDLQWSRRNQQSAGVRLRAIDPVDLREALGAKRRRLSGQAEAQAMLEGLAEDEGGEAMRDDDEVKEGEDAAMEDENIQPPLTRSRIVGSRLDAAAQAAQAGQVEQPSTDLLTTAAQAALDEISKAGFAPEPDSNVAIGKIRGDLISQNPEQVADALVHLLGRRYANGTREFSDDEIRAIRDSPGSLPGLINIAIEPNVRIARLREALRRIANPR
jgi:hypothetical protein